MFRSRHAVLVTAAAIGVTRLIATLWVSPVHRLLDNDEAVYFTAGALTGRGAVPYRDVTVAQPPGILYVLALPGRLWSPLDAIAVARCMTALVGIVGIYLIGRIVARAYPPVVAVGTMILVASLPEAAAAEHSMLIEPWLNLFTVAAAGCWLAGTCNDQRLGRSAVRTGFWLGVALVFKWWALIAVVPVIATVGRRSRSDLARAAGAMVATATVLVAPVVVLAPSDFVQQTIRYQQRRGDGTAFAERVGRVLGLDGTLLGLREALPTAIAVLALAVLLCRRRNDQVLRYGLAWYGAIVAAFLAGPYYGFHYNAHLAPAVGLMAAPVLEEILLALPSPERIPKLLGRAAAAVLVLVAANNLRWVRGDAIASTPGPPPSVRRLATDPGTVFSPTPENVLLADRLPGTDGTGRIVFDPLGASAPNSYRVDETDELLSELRRSDVVVIGPTDIGLVAVLRRSGFVPEAGSATSRSVWRRK